MAYPDVQQFDDLVKEIRNLYIKYPTARNLALEDLERILYENFRDYPDKSK